MKRPTGEDIARVYPDRAARDGVDGRAALDCMIKADGRLGDCKVMLEEPAGAGFGEATLRLSTIFRMQSKSSDGIETAGGRIRIPVRYMVPR